MLLKPNLYEKKIHFILTYNFVNNMYVLDSQCFN